MANLLDSLRFFHCFLRHHKKHHLLFPLPQILQRFSHSLLRIPFPSFLQRCLAHLQQNTQVKIERSHSWDRLSSDKLKISLIIFTLVRNIKIYRSYESDCYGFTWLNGLKFLLSSGTATLPGTTHYYLNKLSTISRCFLAQKHSRWKEHGHYLPDALKDDHWLFMVYSQ